MTQIRAFADAAVVVGFHGAGLALATFAPRGAAVVEIEPEDHSLELFGSLKAAGLRYSRVQLGKGSRDGGEGNRLLEGDARRIEGVLRGRMRETRFDAG